MKYATGVIAAIGLCCEASSGSILDAYRERQPVAMRATGNTMLQTTGGFVKLKKNGTLRLPNGTLLSQGGGNCVVGEGGWIRKPDGKKLQVGGHPVRVELNRLMCNDVVVGLGGANLVPGAALGAYSVGGDTARFGEGETIKVTTGGALVKPLWNGRKIKSGANGEVVYADGSEEAAGLTWNAVNALTTLEGWPVGVEAGEHLTRLVLFSRAETRIKEDRSIYYDASTRLCVAGNAAYVGPTGILSDVFGIPLISAAGGGGSYSIADDGTLSRGGAPVAVLPGPNLP